MLVMGIERGRLVGGIAGRSQGIGVVWIVVKRNSSMTRFVEMLRDRRVRDVDGGLENIKCDV